MDGEIQPQGLAARLTGDEGDPLLVDIRQPAAFRRGHIPGSVNLPLGEFTGGVDAVDGADHVVTVCPHGEASVQAARLIAAYEGFDGRVESLAGGLEAWDGPIEAGDGEGPASSTASSASTAADGSGDPDAPF
jgi:rhodanese-related sulfurtransferase